MPALSVTIMGTTNTLDLVGEKFKGDGYLASSDGLHTVAWTLKSFKGRISMEGTLMTEPGAADWFPIDLDQTGTGYIQFDTTTTATKYYNFTGNFVWVRAVMLRTYDPLLTLQNAGYISKVLYNF